MLGLIFFFLAAFALSCVHCILTLPWIRTPGECALACTDCGNSLGLDDPVSVWRSHRCTHSTWRYLIFTPKSLRDQRYLKAALLCCVLPGWAVPCSCWLTAALRPRCDSWPTLSGTEPKSPKETRKDDLESNWLPGSYLLQSYKCHGGRAVCCASRPSWHPSEGFPLTGPWHPLGLPAKLPPPWYSSCCLPHQQTWVGMQRWFAHGLLENLWSLFK